MRARAWAMVLLPITVYNHAALSSLGVWDSAPADLPWPNGYGLAATDGTLFYVYGSEEDDNFADDRDGDDSNGGCCG